MKKISLILILVITLIIGFLIGINFERNQIKKYSEIDKEESLSPLEYILFQPLTIVYSDEECGEWGGNTEAIKISREDFKSQLIALYTYEKIDCSDPYNERKEPTIIIRKQISLNNSQESLVVEVIKELLTTKLRRENIPTHSGIWNSVTIGDSSLIINDFPSEKLVNFVRLKDEIIKEN
jgi:hypothetical protein